MKWTTLILAAGFSLAAVTTTLADPVVESVQRTLKEQGFYYGEISGAKDADTTAAIRRYQIRNGLQINGELNAETRKSLGVKGNVAATPRATALPRATPRPQPMPRTSAPREDAMIQDEDTTPAWPRGNDPRSLAQRPDYDPALMGSSGLFAGTPFAGAPPDVQQQVIAGAQAMLARRGFYRSEIDGVFGPGTAFALRAYQARFGLGQTGRLDEETLATLGLLPGQRAPGVTAPIGRRTYRRSPVMTAPDGERVYIPR